MIIWRGAYPEIYYNLIFFQFLVLRLKSIAFNISMYSLKEGLHILKNNFGQMTLPRPSFTVFTLAYGTH